jgi:peptidoglycan/xylan/chitin deacetylase (PgdA/CDA1 family)
MREQLQHIISGAIQVLPLPSLIRLTGVHRVLPFYHAVSDTDLPHLKHLYPIISTHQFEKQLDFFLLHFRPASYDILLQNNRPDERYFLLTFDDGLRQVHDEVAPILMRKGIPATFFLNTGFLDNRAMFYRLKVSLVIEKLLKGKNTVLELEVKEACKRYLIDYRQPTDLKKITDQNKQLLDELTEIDFQDFLVKEQPYMTTEEVHRLRKQGFTVGAHSVNHPYFPSLSQEEQIRETLESVRFVKTEFGMNDGLFSFPYTDYEIGTEFFNLIRPEVQLSFGTANLKCDSIATNFQRIPMEIRGLTDAEQLIKKQYVLHLIKKMIGKRTIQRHEW